MGTHGDDTHDLGKLEATLNPHDLAETLSMTEIIRLQDTLSKALVRRFEKRLALAFSDVAGSTAHFARHGDEAGRKLQQRHIDLIDRVLEGRDGRVVDIDGDGVFLGFSTLNNAARSMVELQRRISIDNESRPAEHRLVVRVGIHFGPALTDGTLVSGDSVNFCARVASAAGLSEIKLSVSAYQELTDVGLRLRCRKLKPLALMGIEPPVELMLLDWLDPAFRCPHRWQSRAQVSRQGPYPLRSPARARRRGRQ